MLIAISGSQGSGKSTIIETLIKNNPTYHCVDRKTSRSILSDWGVSLAEVNADPALTLRFQEEILERKVADDRNAVLSNGIWFTERTPIDLLGYATVQLGADNQYSTWLDDYATRCLSVVNNLSLYDHIFFLTAGHFSVSSDGVRGHNQYYSTLVDAAMAKFHTKYVQSHLITVIDSPDMDERLNQINNKNGNPKKTNTRSSKAC